MELGKGQGSPRVAATLLQSARSDGDGSWWCLQRFVVHPKARFPYPGERWTAQTDGSYRIRGGTPTESVEAAA